MTTKTSVASLRSTGLLSTGIDGRFHPEHVADFAGIKRYKQFQHELPIDPSSMTRWRKRLGPEKMEELLLVTIDTAKEKNLLTERHVERVNVDTTVQGKAIAFPTDARLCHKVRRVLVKTAKKMDIDLRKSYERTGKKVFLKQGRYASAGQHNRAKKETKRLQDHIGLRHSGYST